MKAVLLAASIVLAGCAGADPYVRTDVVTKTEYIVRQATDQQKAIPPYPAAIDTKNASQIDLAEWIAASEERQWALENTIKGLVNFYEMPATAAASATASAPRKQVRSFFLIQK